MARHPLFGALKTTQRCVVMYRLTLLCSLAKLLLICMFYRRAHAQTVNITLTVYDGYFSKCMTTFGRHNTMTDTNGKALFNDVVPSAPLTSLMLPLQDLPCHDTFTELAMPFEMRAYAHVESMGTSLVLNSLTTLAASLVDLGASNLTDAYNQLLFALDIPLNTINLGTYDAIDESSNANGSLVLSKLNQVTHIVTLGSALLSGSLGTYGNAQAMFTAMGNKIKHSSNLNLADANMIRTILEECANAQTVGSISVQLATSIAAVSLAVSNLNVIVAGAVGSGMVGAQLLNELSRTQIVSQTVMAISSKSLGNGQMDLDMYHASFGTVASVSHLVSSTSLPGFNGYGGAQSFRNDQSIGLARPSISSLLPHTILHVQSIQDEDEWRAMDGENAKILLGVGVGFGVSALGFTILFLMRKKLKSVLLD